jgi:hypothetical protein
VSDLDRATIIGRVASSVSAPTFVISSIARAPRIGESFQLAAIPPGRDHVVRVGLAVVRDWNPAAHVVTVDAWLNALIPAAAEGDYLLSWAQPCTRCECPRCSADRGVVRSPCA